MKYLAIAVLLAIVVGAIPYATQPPDHPPPADPNAGWMQR